MRSGDMSETMREPCSRTVQTLAWPEETSSMRASSAALAKELCRANSACNADRRTSKLATNASNSLSIDC